MMCGITGLIDFKRQTRAEILTATIYQMTETLRRRGPDDGGVWVHEETGVALGQRRLSIVDLSHEGHQPMFSSSGRYVIVFNGEIYNFMAIKKELESDGNAPAWRGHSDTEVMLAAIECWGLTDTVKKFVGMFAFVLWDRKKRILQLVRDRLGIKPLYYGYTGNYFLFASELKAFVAHPEFKKSINRDVLALFLRYSYIPAPYSIYHGVYKLLPGSILSLGIDDSATGGQNGCLSSLSASGSSSNCIPYWSARMVAEKGQADLYRFADDSTTDAFEKLLLDAARLRMAADVPLGAFLSGGVDSTLVVALMQAQSINPVKTFTIGFYEDKYNEARYAKEIALHLGTDHTELYVTPEEAMAVIPKLPFLYDEPFADSSQIPTFLVSELARRHVKVSLSGDGGDELFGGYDHYSLVRSAWRVIDWMPLVLKKNIAATSRFISPQAWDRVFSKLNWAVPARFKHFLSGDKLLRLSDIIAVNNRKDLYQGIVSQWNAPTSVVLGAKEPPTLLSDQGQWGIFANFILQMMYIDLVTYLPDDILVKVDRASMGVSLEARVPLLDHRVVEFAWNLPFEQRIRNGQGKWLLHQVLHKYVPRELIERPKMGFGIPVGNWLRGPLRGWAEELLDENKIKRQGFFKAEPIRRIWSQHLSDTRNWQHLLWDVLMFQAWLAEWGESY